MKSYPSVSIVFPNFNGGRQPMECIDSIKKLNYPKNKIEIIVVDNNSTDGSLENIKYQISNIKYTRFAEASARRADQEIKVIENKENLGFATAINQGIKRSNGEHIFITNDDIVFEKDSIKNLVEYALTHPDVGILGGKIFLKNNPLKVISCGYMMNKWTGNVYPSPNYNKVHEPDWIQGCAILIPRKVINKIGLFDQGFSLIYFEDYDLCIRARKKGFKVVYIPNAHIWHGGAVTMNKNKQNKYYQWYKNKLRFIVKNLAPLNILSILLIQFFIITPYRALVLRDRRFIPFLKGLFWNITHLPQTLEARRNMI